MTEALKISCNQGKPLGKGTFGYAVHCLDNDESKKYVVKRLHKNENKYILQLFITEKKLQLKLKHDNIVKAFNITVTGIIQPYLVLEYCNQGDLFDYYYNNDDFNTNKVKIINELVYGIGRAIIYLHNLQLLHHDIKIENIFVHIDGDNIQLKLGDFGQVKYVGLDSYTSKISGTPAYLPLYLFDDHDSKQNNEGITYKITQQINRNPGYIIDWYGYFCIICELLYYRINEPATSLEEQKVMTTLSFYIPHDAQSTPIGKILKTIICKDLLLYFYYSDDNNKSSYNELHDIIENTEEPITDEMVNMEYGILNDSGSIKKEIYNFTLSVNNMVKSFNTEGLYKPTTDIINTIYDDFYTMLHTQTNIQKNNGGSFGLRSKSTSRKLSSNRQQAVSISKRDTANKVLLGPKNNNISPTKLQQLFSHSSDKRSSTMNLVTATGAAAQGRRQSKRRN